MKNEKSIQSFSEKTRGTRPLKTLSRWCKKGVLRQLKKIRHGHLRLEDGPERNHFGPGDAPHRACIRVLDRRFYTAVGLGGAMGAAEAYIQGWWTCDDLVSLIRIMILDRRARTEMPGWLLRLLQPVIRLYQQRFANTLVGSRRNIAAHYDLSNDFYALFLDETMTYSSGIFKTPASTLKEASIEKLDRICRKLRLGKTDRILEIGTGWGSFAIHAARTYGCHVTTTTLSEAQYAFARKAVEAAGLSDRITLIKKDYRTLDGQYDKLVSIEMIEAVGYAYIPDFFRACSGLLKPEGLMALQAITLSDQAFDRYRRSVDFIRRSVFPGACLISLSHVLNSLKKETDMRLLQLEDITPHYAETLRQWRERFLSRLDDVRKLGFPDPFIRLWEFYLVYCEGGFREEHIGDVQMVLAKSGYRGPR